MKKLKLKKINLKKKSKDKGNKKPITKNNVSKSGNIFCQADEGESPNVFIEYKADWRVSTNHFKKNDEDTEVVAAKTMQQRTAIRSFLF